MTHFVYRYYNADGRLLYVGCSKNPWTRYKTHRQDSRLWINEVARGRISVFPDQATALEAERAAIIAEKPLYNKTHRWEHREDWSAQDYVDYAQGLLRTSHHPYDTYRGPRMTAVREVYRSLFGEPLPVRPRYVRRVA